MAYIIFAFHIKTFAKKKHINSKNNKVVLTRINIRTKSESETNAFAVSVNCPAQMSSGETKSAERAKKMKTTAPTSVTVLTEILDAIMRPLRTATPVHRPWPRVPPTTVPNMFSRAPRMIVLICERSPHSARNVRMKACKRNERTSQ